MKINPIKAMMLLASVTVAAASQAVLVNYSQNFESMTFADGNALGSNGWKVFGNVFNGSGGYLYGYGVFNAPNNAGGFCGLATGEGGVAQGNQYLNTFSDYNNGDHGNTDRILEANIFQEQVIGSSDLGNTYNFTFNYKASSQYGPSGATTTQAFFKVLNPNAGYATVAYPQLNTTSASGSVWANGQLSITIDPSWTGHILQFGFQNTARNYQPSGVYYDNINFQAVPEPTTMTALALGAAAIMKRKKK